MSNTQVANITFHGHNLITAKQGDTIMVAMKPICENIGLQWEAQYKRINRHPVMKSSMSMMDMVAEDGKQREMVMLPAKMLNGWLFGVDVNRVNEAARPALIQYQEECFDALYSYWNVGVAINPRLPITPEQQSDLFTMVANINPDGKQRGMIWSRFNRHFKIAKYSQLPQDKFEEAKTYLVEVIADGEYIEREEMEQYVKANATSLADIKAILTSGMCDPAVKVSDTLRMAINQKSFAVAHEFFETFQKHLARRIAYTCEAGYPVRTINEAKALKIVEETSIDSALTHHYYGLLNNVHSMSENLKVMTDAYSKDIARALGKRTLLAA